MLQTTPQMAFSALPFMEDQVFIAYHFAFIRFKHLL